MEYTYTDDATRLVFDRMIRHTLSELTLVLGADEFPAFRKERVATLLAQEGSAMPPYGLRPCVECQELVALPNDALSVWSKAGYDPRCVCTECLLDRMRKLRGA